jgi:hypothetical protein
MSYINTLRKIHYTLMKEKNNPKDAFMPKLLLF